MKLATNSLRALINQPLGRVAGRDIVQIDLVHQVINGKPRKERDSCEAKTIAYWQAGIRHMHSLALRISQPVKTGHWCN